VLGGLAAASMPRTPRHPTPPYLRQISGDGKKHQGTDPFPRGNGSVLSLFMDTHEVHPRMTWIYPVAGKKKAERGLGSAREKRVHGNCREHAT
ncbi:hypothetical protein, partial [Stenotrophomonas sp. AR026]|uniref:hypothetical protein n=1 Tax=Stenotrophomonas sp. AR026 TaxID=3398462 RepID=UPI003BAE2CF4